MLQLRKDSVEPVNEPAKTPERWLLGLAAVLLCLQPLANAEMWWHIARGNAVRDGGWQPTQTLLINEQLPNSDWLSGTAPAIAFASLGVTGLMLLKLLAALLIGWQLQRKSEFSSWNLLCSVLFLVAAEPAFDPTPGTVDLLGILLTASLATQRRHFSLFACAAVWANFSVGALWAIPTFLCFASTGTSKPVRHLLGWTCALCAGLSLTPRGIASLYDMVALFAPWLFNDAAFLTGTEYAACRITLPVLSAILLGLAAVTSPKVPASKKILISSVTVCGLLTARNMPVAGALSGLILLGKTSNTPLTNRLQGPAVRIGVVVFAVIVVLWNVSGGIDGRGERLGWGVADKIDIRFAERDLQQHQNSELRAHCTDIVGAGTLLMACPAAKVIDVPEAAIRSGRLQKLWLMNHDLSTGRKAAFTRQDGSEGGWWRALINNNISLIVVSAHREEILTSLEPTLWKPLSLDAPTLILVTAGIPQFTTQILRARAERNLIDSGDWQHKLYNQTPQPSHSDLWALAGGAPDRRVDLRQARVFRAMQMPTGAARTLLAVLGHDGRPAATPEFVRLQRFLAWNEWLDCGHVSTLRRQVLGYFCQEVVVPGIAASDLAVDQNSMISPDAIRLYCSGNALAAANSLRSATAESLYAQHCLFREAGNSINAEAVRSTLEANFPDHPLTALIRMLRDVE